MEGYRFCRGDCHRHIPLSERADEVIEAARRNLDVYTVPCYSFRVRRENGALVETVRQRPAFLEDWKVLAGACRA